MGRNELSVFVYNESKWGDMGRNRLSPLEMGSKGRGEGIQDPQAKEVERQVDRKLNLDSECGARRRSRIGTQPRAAVPHEFGSHRQECLCHRNFRRRGRLRSTTHLDFGARCSSFTKLGCPQGQVGSCGQQV